MIIPVCSLYFKTGESVRVKHEGEGRSAKVIEIADTPRSYLVKTSDGDVYWRNRIHLHKDTSQDQFDQYADVKINTEVNQPSGEQSSNRKAWKTNNKKQAIRISYETCIVHVQDD